MLPDAYLSHQTSGRLRLKIPSKKGKTEYFVSLKDQMSRCSGVDKVEVNSMTGSALIIHVSDAEAVGKYARENNLFVLHKLNTHPGNLHMRVSETFKGINKKVKGFTGGEMDVGTLAFLALAGAGIYQISRGNIAAIPWYAAFWYALNIFLKSNK